MRWRQVSGRPRGRAGPRGSRERIAVGEHERPAEEHHHEPQPGGKRRPLALPFGIEAELAFEPDLVAAHIVADGEALARPQSGDDGLEIDPEVVADAPQFRGRITAEILVADADRPTAQPAAARAMKAGPRGFARQSRRRKRK